VKQFIGYFCSYVPLELVTAAGFEPYRISGIGDFPEKSYSFFPGNFCMFAKSCLNEGLTLDSEKFAGFIFTNSCDSMERLYDVWKEYLPFKFVNLLNVPRIYNSSSCEYFSKNLKNLIKTLEKQLKIEISDESIKDSISLYNRERELFKEITILRARKDYYIPSSLIMDVISNKSSKDSVNKKFKEIIDNKEDFSSKHKGPRILISGSVMEDLTLVQIIEEAGGNIVYEDFCSINRHFDEPVDQNLPPLPAIAKRYLEKSPCARMKDSSLNKIIKIRELVAKYSIDGIIFYLIKFCDVFSWEIHTVSTQLSEEKIPVLIIEGDYPVKAKGQINTRIEAFIEMLSEE